MDYVGREKNRVSAGITNGRVFRRAEGPNDLVILQDVANVTQTRTWLIKACADVMTTKP
jgi:hypothetical protein